MPPKKDKFGQQKPFNEGDRLRGRNPSSRKGQKQQGKSNYEGRSYQNSGSGYQNSGSGSSAQISVPPSVPNAWNRQQLPTSSLQMSLSVPGDAGKEKSQSSTISKIAMLCSSQVSDASEPPTKQPYKLDIKEVNAMVAQIPKRENVKNGQNGQRIRVLTNMLPIIYGPNFPKVCFKYDVEIKPDKSKYLFNEIFKVVKHAKFAEYSPAFDGRKFLYSAKKLFKENELTMEVNINNSDNKELTYQVTIKKVEDLNFEQLKRFGPGVTPTLQIAECLQALNIILQQPAYVKEFLRVGRSFFTINPNPTQLTGGMDLQHGLFQSALMTWKPLLNVDVAHKGFPSPQSVINLVQDLTNKKNPTMDDIREHQDKINGYLRGLRVTYEVIGARNERIMKRSRQIVNSLVMKTPEENFFPGPENKKMNVQIYYEEKKKYKIKYPHYPCLWIGNRNKNCHVPIELCTIEAGQITRKKLDENQTRIMVRNSTAGTKIRQSKIKELVNQVKHDQSPCLKEFDIKIGNDFEEVPARILNPPKLTYYDTTVTPDEGVWFSDLFLHPSNKLEKTKSWTILNLSFLKSSIVEKFSREFQKTAINKGIIIGQPLTPFKFIRPKEVNLESLKNFFNDFKRQGVEFVIVIFSDKHNDHYHTIKKAAELQTGILTQCIKSLTVEKNLKLATLVNILLKVNAKLDGTNHSLDKNTSRPQCLSRPCMIVGADVSHPSPDSTNIPSITGVTASHDRNAFLYNIQVRLQDPKQEIIADLKNIMVEHLKVFKDKTNCVPGHIIYLRDGVSHGQFEEVLTKELTAIRAACTSLNQSYKPMITFFVVQKRHHIRLFPIDKGDSEYAFKNFNVKAGTVVDTVITHPTDIDFYLVSHPSIQGTARPTKYVCLHDDAKMDIDEMQSLIYYLCHMFARCTRSVSYPAPTYYAHLAAFRARNLIQGEPIDLGNLAEGQKKFLNIHEDILKGQPMFFV